MSTIIIETRRSKGIHKADLTQMNATQIKSVLDYYNSNSYVAVKNYRTDSMEIKFERMASKGMINYSLKTSLSVEDFKSIGFSKTEKGNMHLTQTGCTINSRWDVEVKEPVKKIESKKSKAEKAEKAESTSSSKKQPLPFKKSTSSEETKVENTTTEESAVEASAKQPLPAK